MNKKNRLKIAIFHLGFFYSGGGEKLVLEEIRGLTSMGHDVTCFAPYVDRENCFPDYPEMSEIRSLIPPPPRWLPIKDALWVALSCLLIPFIAPRFRNFDILIGANQPGPWYAWVVGKLLSKPYIIYLSQPLRLLHPRKVDKENGLRIREGDHRFLKLITQLAGWLIDIVDRASVRDAAIMLSDGAHVSQWLRGIYQRDDRICPAGCHPISPSELNYKQRWLGQITLSGYSIRRPFILLSNRHAPHKRFEYALWALKSLVREFPDLTMVVTGQETTYTDQLRYLARGLSIDQHVKFVGLISERDLATLYGDAALYVYPSPEEDFGMGIIEAMASGTPVVAWNNGGPTGTVLNGETGFLVEPYDTDSFAWRISALLANPDLAEKMGRAANRHAELRFSFDHHNLILDRAVRDAIQDRIRVYKADESSPALRLPTEARVKHESYWLAERDDVLK